MSHGGHRKWNNIYKMLKENNYQSKIPYPKKICFRNEGEIEISSDEAKETKRISCQQICPKRIVKGISSDSKQGNNTQKMPAALRIKEELQK